MSPLVTPDLQPYHLQPKKGGRDEDENLSEMDRTYRAGRERCDLRDCSLPGGEHLVQQEDGAGSASAPFSTPGGRRG